MASRLLSFVIIIFMTAVLVTPFNLVLAQNAPNGNFGLDSTAKKAFNNTGYDPTEKNSDIVTIVGRIINVALSFLGSIFLILIIYGGFIWMTAGGNDEKIHKAIQLFTAASYGLLIVIAAYLITRYMGTAIINSLQ